MKSRDAKVCQSSGIKETFIATSLMASHMLLPVGSLSRAQLFATPWTAAHQAPLSMEISRQEHWNRLLFPTKRDVPDPRVETESCISCFGRCIVYHWASREAPLYMVIAYLFKNGIYWSVNLLDKKKKSLDLLENEMWLSSNFPEGKCCWIHIIMQLLGSALRMY